MTPVHRLGRAMSDIAVTPGLLMALSAVNC